MNRRLLLVAAILLVAIGIVGTSSIFIVDQTEQAIVLQFGEPRRAVPEPGLHFKRPFVEDVVFYDNRVLDYEPPPEEVIASDQKRIVVDSYARYRIIDPLAFYKTIGVESAARTRLSALVSGSLRRVLGNVTLSAVLSQQRDQIMRQIRDEVNGQARSFGIDVIDVRLRRADLPEENSQAVYARMKSERQREAAEFRAQGAEAAQRIRSLAERDRTVLLAEAQRDAQKVRGEGDAESIRTYAAAFGQDKDFFAFYRSMQAYREALAGRNTAFVISPDSAFFRFFNQPLGTAPATPAGTAAATPPSAPSGAAAPSGPAGTP